MVWTVVTYQTGQLVSQTEMNQLRDNLVLLGLHNHGSSTGSGAGSPQLGGLESGGTVSGSGIEFHTMPEQNPIPSAPSVAGEAIYYAVATTSIGWRNTTGTFVMANATHTHTAL